MKLMAFSSTKGNGGPDKKGKTSGAFSAAVENGASLRRGGVTRMFSYGVGSWRYGSSIAALILRGMARSVTEGFQCGVQAVGSESPTFIGTKCIN